MALGSESCGISSFWLFGLVAPRRRLCVAGGAADQTNDSFRPCPRGGIQMVLEVVVQMADEIGPQSSNDRETGASIEGSKRVADRPGQTSRGFPLTRWCDTQQPGLSREGKKDIIGRDDTAGQIQYHQLCEALRCHCVAHVAHVGEHCPE